MPVTLQVADHGARSITRLEFAQNATDVLKQAGFNWKSDSPPKVLQSSFNDEIATGRIHGCTNGLFDAVQKAYGQHHHLILRPEDIWFTILSQFSFYVNGHAEELRRLFVPHKGRKSLVVESTGSRYDFDFGQFACQMTELMKQHIIDPSLRDWMIPDFSTTTEDDKVIASVMMMGTMQNYFAYSCMTCGIPTVTLLGEKEDYERLLTKLDKFIEFGAETAKFATMLRPILRRFIMSFDDPTGTEIRDFWNNVMMVDQGCDSTSYTGWIIAFCFWDEDGRRLCREPRDYEIEYGRKLLQLDDVTYGWLDRDIPSGGVKVPMIFDGMELIMVAGSIGMTCTSSGKIEQLEVLRRLSWEEKSVNSAKQRARKLQSLLKKAWGRRNGEVPREPGCEVRDTTFSEDVRNLYGPSPLDTVQPLAGWWLLEKR